MAEAASEKSMKSMLDITEVYAGHYPMRIQGRLNTQLWDLLSASPAGCTGGTFKITNSMTGDNLILLSVMTGGKLAVGCRVIGLTNSRITTDPAML